MVDAKFQPRAGSAVDQNIVYHPPPSIGHEIGVIFGFIGVMVVCMAVYGVLWQVGNKRSQQREHNRVEKLKASGLLKEMEGPDGLPK